MKDLAFSRILLSLVFLGCAQAELWAQAPTDRAPDKRRQKITTPGSSTEFSWSTSDINACRSTGKPIMLYDLRSSGATAYLELTREILTHG